jgi:hypothetical protein
VISLNDLPLKRPDSYSKRNKSVIWNTAKKHSKLILEGTMLCVDPSIGSNSSMPGYAIYSAGELVDSGTIRLPTSGNHTLRLYELSRSIREDFADLTYDLLIVEEIPMVRYEKFGRSLQAQIPLHRAVGAVLGALPIATSMEVPPNTWRSFLDVAQYNKTDESDAVMLGWAALEMARITAEQGAKKQNLGWEDPNPARKKK